MPKRLSQQNGRHQILKAGGVQKLEMVSSELRKMRRAQNILKGWKPLKKQKA